MTRILIVDDEPQVRKLLRIWLEAEGHEIVAAPDGRKALDAYGRQEFDLVITDVLMPDMDGIEFLRRLHEKHNKCRLIAISGGASYGGDFLQRMKLFGASQTLAKPFTGDELNQVVRELLDVRPAS